MHTQGKKKAINRGRGRRGGACLTKKYEGREINIPTPLKGSSKEVMQLTVDTWIEFPVQHNTGVTVN